MDTQQMMELLLAMREDMKASNDNTKVMNEKMNEFKEVRKIDRGNKTRNKSRSGKNTRESKENDGRNDEREPSQDRRKA
jgi:hypothetical protein